jgi:hypothetical protein
MALLKARVLSNRRMTTFCCFAKAAFSAQPKGVSSIYSLGRGNGRSCRKREEGTFKNHNLVEIKIKGKERIGE